MLKGNSASAVIQNQQTEIRALQASLEKEKEKIIALENYSRRENLRFMNIPERKDENCFDVIYDIIENELRIDPENILFRAVHRIGKPREADYAKPRPIIARFLCREDRDKVYRIKNRLKKSRRFKDAYITQDYICPSYTNGAESPNKSDVFGQRKRSSRKDGGQKTDHRR